MVIYVHVIRASRGLLFINELLFAIQILTSQSADRRAIKSVSVVGSYVWHEKLAHIGY